MKLAVVVGCDGVYFIVAIDKENQTGCLTLFSVPAPVFELHSGYTRLRPSVDILIWV